MGRNKYPEQTQERIVEASVKLFIEEGYEQTTIQDILDALNLSKGGVMCLLGLDIIDKEFIENITGGYDKTRMF